MPRHRRPSDQFPCPLPIGLELALLGGSILAGELFAAVAFWLSITTRLTPIRQAFGLEVDLAQLITGIGPLLALAGLIAGLQFYFKMRKWLARKLTLV